MRGEIFGKGQRSDGASAFVCKVVGFLVGSFLGVAAEAAAGAAAAGGTDDTVYADVDAAGFVRCSTKQRTCICNVLFSAFSLLYFCSRVSSSIESLLSGSGDVAANTTSLAAFSAQSSTLFFFAMMT